MRLWSIHPRYLDPKGLVALWREGLLAQKVLAGKTKGYRHHPQLIRFREEKNPIAAISAYLREVAQEATRRGYRFDETKILRKTTTHRPIRVTRGQMKFEFQHLLAKLKTREPRRFEELRSKKTLKPHPSFQVVPGQVQSWEKV